ncbi:MAG: DUF190 domain-containing protein [Actinomycetota bacterium]
MQPSRGGPVVIEIVDKEQRIDHIIPILDEMVGEGMMTLEKVHIAYRSNAKETN